MTRASVTPKKYKRGRGRCKNSARTAGRLLSAPLRERPLYTTGAVAADEIGIELTEFVAVTATVSLAPASAVPGTYVWLTAPGIAVQFAPAASQRFH